ncbi:MAG: endonuclease domain-containing protein [Candidatus Anammoxibacter sp.]
MKYETGFLYYSPLERGVAAIADGVCKLLPEDRYLTMIINYNSKLKGFAGKLRNNSTKSEIRLWQYLKGKKMMGYDFHRQKPIDSFIVDFFCNKLNLAIELDGYTHTFVEIAIKGKLRQEKLQGLEISMLRFSDEEVIKNTEGVLMVIKGFIRVAEG